MKLSELKRRKIRRTIGDGDHPIEIYNPDIEERKEILRVLASGFSTKTMDFTISEYEVLVMLIPMLTNVELDLTNDELVKEIMDDPSETLLDIQEELVEIIKDITRRFIKVMSESNDLEDLDDALIEEVEEEND